jgi:hypothetical protein
LQEKEKPCEDGVLTETQPLGLPEGTSTTKKKKKKKKKNYKEGKS